MTAPFEQRGYRDAALALAKQAGIALVPYLDEEARPTAAAMLSPVPAASTAPDAVRPTTSEGAASLGSSIRGSSAPRPNAQCAMSGNHSRRTGE